MLGHFLTTTIPASMLNKSHTFRNTISQIATLLCMAIALIPNSLSAENKAESVEVLILTGMEHPAHDWKARTVALQEVLSTDQRFKVTVKTDPEFLANKELFNYDVILMNFYSGKKDYPGKASKDNLVKFVGERGKGLFILHFACGNFHDWDEFSNLAGLIFTPQGRGRFHDPLQAFKVDITDPDHAITKGMKPQLDAHDECYYCLGQATRDYNIIATARSKDTKKDHPMALYLNYGKGRVFNTPLGHDAKSVKMPDIADLIRRGLFWAANSPNNQK